MSAQLFRPKALENLQGPSEHLDELMRVTSPRAWIALTAALAVVASAVLYGVFGTAATTIEARGVFLAPGGLIQVQAPVAGTVTELLVEEGSIVEAGDVIASIAPISSAGELFAPVHIRSTTEADIAELFIRSGSIVAVGQAVATMDPLVEGVAQPTVVLFISASQGKQVAKGMRVLVSPSTAPSEQYGQVVGEVVTVSEFPASPERIQFVVQNESLAGFLGETLVLELTVSLQPSRTLSELRWTAGEGPPFKITHGTVATASVIVDQETPASHLFGEG